MNRLWSNLLLRLGGFAAGLAMLVAPRTTMRFLERQLKVVLAQKMLEAALERQPRQNPYDLPDPSNRSTGA